MIMERNPVYNFLDIFVMLDDVDERTAPLVELYVNMMGRNKYVEGMYRV